MVSTRKRSITVDVMLHLTASGQYCCAIRTHEWQGAVRIDRRLWRLRALDRSPSRPLGVSPEVYDAWRALGLLVAEQAGEVPQQDG